MLEPDNRYKATVKQARLIESNTKGTPGISITFETDEGCVEHTIWLTENTVERAAKDLCTLGADLGKLSSGEYLENIGQVLTLPCEITTIDSEYNGKHTIKVQWINPVKAGARNGKLSNRAAKLFGGPVVPGWQAPDNLITDDDMPF